MVNNGFFITIIVSFFAFSLHSLAAFQPSNNCQNSNQTTSTVRVIVLFDISPFGNDTFFKNQQSAVETVLRHIDSRTKHRRRLFGLVAFHRLAVVLSNLKSAHSRDVEKILDQIHSLKPRRRHESSPSKALDVAAELIDESQIEEGGGKEVGTLVFLVHEGRNTNLIAETLEAIAKLSKNGATIFAISNGDSFNEHILLGYTKERKKILAKTEENDQFFATIDREIGACVQNEMNNDGQDGDDGKEEEGLGKNEGEGGRLLGFNCEKGKEVDLTLLLDTSGSIFHSFAQQRQIALDLLSGLKNDSQSAGQLHVGLVSFAANPSTVLSLREGVRRQEMLDRLRAVQFTGMNTRIGDAVELALEELEKFGQKNALKVLVLISDGHGQEDWARTQAVGRRLQQFPKLQLFAVSASPDFNRPELALYVGDQGRIFVGQRHQSFVQAMSTFLNKCLVGKGEMMDDAGAEEEETGRRGTEKQQIREKSATMEDRAKLGKGGRLATENGKITTNKKGERSKRDHQSIDEVAEKITDAKDDEEEFVGRNDGGQAAEEKGGVLASECPTDLLFLIDRFSPDQKFSPLFERQLGLAVQLVERVQARDVGEGKIRLAAVSFGREPRMEAQWPEGLSKADFQRRLRTIQPAKVQSSFVAALNLTLQQIHFHRRSSARLLLFVFWSGSNGRNTAEELISRAVRPFGTLPRTELFAVSVNPSAQLGRLRNLAGDQWHVFLDGRTKQFVDQASAILLDCVLPPSGDLLGEKEADHEPRDSVERVEHLQLAARALQRQSADCKNDPIDLTIVLHYDPQKSSPEQLDGLKRAAMDALKQAPVEHFARRIRLSILADSQLVLSPLNPAKLDDALFALDRIEWEEKAAIKVANLTEMVEQALGNAEKWRRDGARTGLVLLTDGNGGRRAAMEAAKGRHKQGAIFVLNFGATPAKQADDGDEFSSRPTNSLIRHFNAKAQGQMARFVDEFRRRVIWCRDGKLARADSVLPAEGRQRHSATAAGGGLFIKEREEGEEKEGGKKEDEKEMENNGRRNNNVGGKEKVSTTLPPPPNTTSSSSSLSRRPSSAGGDDECKVDLLLVIDTSQSVSEEFQQQLNFVVELVKRLPDQDFAERVQIGVVSFQRTARLQFALGEVKEKEAIIRTLLAIQHTGGSTSAVNGINLAVDEAGKRRRKDARLMIVLVSDGNSQDPWGDVLGAAARLRAIQAEVYAVTVSHDYFFRELEMYAGNKWFVYIDARIRQFLEEAEMSLIECRSPSIPVGPNEAAEVAVLPPQSSSSSIAPSSPSSPTTIVPASISSSTLASGDCPNEPVDLMFILDTSTSVERDFYAQKIFALDLVRVLPEHHFSKRLSIALVKFHAQASLQFPFLTGRRRDDVLYELERVEHTGGQTSLVAAVEMALAEIGRGHRQGARLIVIIISDGNSQDEWARVQETAQKLRNATGGELYAVTLSEKYALDELLEYTQDDGRIYRGDQGSIERFLQDVGPSIVVGCSNSLIPNLNLTNLLLADEGKRTRSRAAAGLTALADGRVKGGGEFSEDQGLVQLEKGGENGDDEETKADGEDDANGQGKGEKGKCRRRYTKMDLIIILDASTSRESVFEHQRELALSLVERLPINRQDTHVATGINSFTNVPVLRQTLGLGRDRKMVRKAIEDIKYRGGSTLTSKAVELAVQDLARGRRRDALQVVVLMNDGMSQDPWERVLASSQKLTQTGAERFGVALGEEVDLRELRHYIGDDQRIYRDGSTERFLQDVVALLEGPGGQECGDDDNGNNDDDGGGGGIRARDEGEIREGAGLVQFQVDNACQGPKLDLVVLLDNTDTSLDGNDPKLNANRYLLLDVLGSLPLGHRVQIAVLSIGDLRLEYQFSDSQQREALFRHIERIRPIKGRPNYAKAVETALNYYSANRRADAKGMMLLVGDGRNTVESGEGRNRAAGGLVEKLTGLDCHAVDSSKTVDEQTLVAFTGSRKRIYPYDRNSEFAHFLLAQTMASEECKGGDENGGREREEKVARKEEETIRRGREGEGRGREKVARKGGPLVDGQRQQKDIIGSSRAGEGDEKKLFGGGEEKVLARRVGKEDEDGGKKKEEGRQNLQKLASRLRAEYRPTGGADEGESSNSGRPSPPSPSPPATTINAAKATSNRPEAREKGSIGSSRPSSSTPSAASRTTGQRRSSTPPLPTTSNPPRSRTPHRPSGCVLDVLLLIDSSGSVEMAFQREKDLAAEILQKLTIGPDNARVALIKFAAAGKVRTVHSFGAEQSRERLLAELEGIRFSDGITAIHSALQQAIIEYSPLKGARPGLAQRLAVVFTDGFGMQDFEEDAQLLRRAVPNIYAVAVDNDNQTMPVAMEELARISGDPKRVFTSRNVPEMQKQLREVLRGC